MVPEAASGKGHSRVAGNRFGRCACCDWGSNPGPVRSRQRTGIHGRVQPGVLEIWVPQMEGIQPLGRQTGTYLK